MPGKDVVPEDVLRTAQGPVGSQEAFSWGLEDRSDDGFNMNIKFETHQTTQGFHPG
jgi:hypothetical protein